MTSERRSALKLIPASKPIDRPRFEDVLVEHLDGLYRTAVRLTRRREAAEDLVQEACLKAFRAYEQLEHPGSARSWLFKILLNTFKNDAKKQKTEFIDLELSEALIASSQLCAYDQQGVLGGLLEDEVQQALENLPEDFRIAIILSDLEDWSIAEISESLGCPAGTIASRLFRGRQLLRESLEAFARRRGLL